MSDTPNEIVARELDAIADDLHAITQRITRAYRDLRAAPAASEAREPHRNPYCPKCGFGGGDRYADGCRCAPASAGSDAGPEPHPVGWLPMHAEPAPPPSGSDATLSDEELAKSLCDFYFGCEDTDWTPHRECWLGLAHRARQLLSAPQAQASDPERSKWDASPGDVIHADADGTIVLDDGPTTYHPLRACAFLRDALDVSAQAWAKEKTRADGLDCKLKNLSAAPPAQVVRVPDASVVGGSWGMGWNGAIDTLRRLNPSVTLVSESAPLRSPERGDEGRET